MSGPNDITIKLGLDDAQLPAPVQRVNTAIASIGKTGEVSARQTAAAMRMLPAQFTDVATQLAGGQNPLLVILQQGGQIKDSFGGARAAVVGLASAVTPAAVGIGGLVAGVGLLATAAIQGSRESERLRDTVAMTGNAAGLTGARFQAMAEQVALSTQQTVSESKTILLQLANSGQVSNRVMESMSAAVGRVADVTGGDAEKIASDFVSMSAGVAKWAAEHNKAWNFISVEQYRYIRRLEEQGKAEEAMIYVSQQAIKHTQDQAGNLGYIERLLDSGAKKWAQFWDAAYGVGRVRTAAQQLAKVQSDIQAILDASGGKEPARGSASAMRIDALRQQQEGLHKLDLAEREQADARARNAAKERKAIEDERKREAEANASRRRGGSREFVGPPTFDEQFPKPDTGLIESLRRDNQTAQEAFRRSEIESYASIDALLRAEAEAQEKRGAAEAQTLQQMRDANRRADAELIEDQRARGEALIALDLEIARRRIQAQGLSGGARDEALRLAEDQSLLSRRRLEVDLRQSADKLSEDTGRALYDDTRSAISAAFRDSDDPIKAFGNALANTIYTRATSGLVDALATAAVGRTGSGGLLGDLLGIVGNIGGGGLSIDTGGYGITPGDGSIPLPTRGGMATGTNYVPRNMIAKLHEGEAVVPKRYNPAAGGTGPGSGESRIVFQQTLHMHIDARSDAAQVAQIAHDAAQNGVNSLVETLQAQGRL